MRAVMYIANQNYLTSAGLVRQGEKVAKPSKRHIERGMVREIKVVEPELKDANSESVPDQPERKPARKAKRSKQSND